MTVNARSGIPAGVGKSGMVDPHSQDVFSSEACERRQSALEARIAVRPAAHEMTIKPNLGIVIDAVELDRDELVGIVGVEPEMSTIPADTTGGITVAAAVLGAQGPFATPVVRHI